MLGCWVLCNGNEQDLEYSLLSKKPGLLSRHDFSSTPQPNANGLELPHFSRVCRIYCAALPVSPHLSLPLSFTENQPSK